MFVLKKIERVQLSLEILPPAYQNPNTASIEYVKYPEYTGSPEAAAIVASTTSFITDWRLLPHPHVWLSAVFGQRMPFYLTGILHYKGPAHGYALKGLKDFLLHHAYLDLCKKGTLAGPS